MTPEKTLKIKKFKRGSPEIVIHLINKELEKYKLTYDNILDYPEFNGTPWYQHFTFDSYEEYESWKEYCIKFLTIMITPKYTKTKAEREFAWFNLMYGLKFNFDV